MSSLGEDLLAVNVHQIVSPALAAKTQKLCICGCGVSTKKRNVFQLPDCRAKRRASGCALLSKNKCAAVVLGVHRLKDMAAALSGVRTRRMTTKTTITVESVVSDIKRARVVAKETAKRNVFVVAMPMRASSKYILPDVRGIGSMSGLFFLRACGEEHRPEIEHWCGYFLSYKWLATYLEYVERLPVQSLLLLHSARSVIVALVSISSALILSREEKGHLMVLGGAAEELSNSRDTRLVQLRILNLK
jgi:hypothetical protein